MIQQVLAPTSEQLEAARRVISDHLAPTPIATLMIRGRPVVAKLEGLQLTGSFKVRGGLAAVDAARRDDARGAVVTASAGNHGLGIAYAATRLGVAATVVVPANASMAKVTKLRHYDVELIQFGSSYDDAQAHAKEIAEERSIRYISAFNDPNVIAGQATVFDEMLSQCTDLEHLVVPVGGGGLISGVLLSRGDHERTDVRITGVQPERSHAMYDVLHGVASHEVVHFPTIADGLAGGGDDGSVTNDIIAHHEVTLVLVPEGAIRHAVREAAETNGLVVEGASATPYAAIAECLIGDETSKVGFIASGRNIAIDLLRELLSDPPEEKVGVAR